MLKLMCDLKCGYFERYMVEKNFSFNLSFLAKAELFNKINDALGIKHKFEVRTEEELFNLYADNPINIIREYNLNTMLLNVASSAIALKYFPEVFDKNTAPIIFPEVFQITNYRLLLTSEQESDDDAIFDFLQELADEQANNEEQEQVEETTEDNKSHFDA